MEGTIHMGSLKPDNRRLKTLPGLMILSCHCNIQMVGTEVNNMLYLLNTSYNVSMNKSQ